MLADEAAVLHKLFRLYARRQDVIVQVRRFSASPDDCAEKLDSHERYAAGRAACPDTVLGRTLEADPTLRQVFCQVPALSTVNPAVLSILTTFADARPGPGGSTITKDGSFAYIVGAVVDEAGTTTMDRLQNAFVRRLVDLSAELPVLVNEIREMSTREDYRELVRGLDLWLDKQAVGPEPPGEPAPDIARFVYACEPALRGTVDRAVLQAIPRISQIPIEFVQSLPHQPIQGQTQNTTPGFGALVQRAQQARDTLNAMVASDRDKLELPVRLRLAAAKELLDRRKFVKAQMLEFGWPQVLDRVRAPGGDQRLRELERAVLEPHREPSLTTSWAELLADERLVEFLRIPPYFQDIPFGELADLATQPGQQSKTTSPLVSTKLGEKLEQPVELAFTAYTELQLVINPTDGEGQLQNGNVVEAQLALKRAADNGSVAATSSMQLEVSQMRKMLAALERSYQRPPTHQQRMPTEVMMMLPDDEPSPEEILMDLGLTLWRAAFFDESFRDVFLRALDDAERVRLVVIINEPRLAEVPWESVYIPELQVFSGQTLKLSVIRNVAKSVDLASRKMGRPLRVLAVASSPVDLPWINAEQEVEILRRTLEPAERDGIVRLDVLKAPNLEELRSSLRRLQPHIFHFIGHGAVQPDGNGLLALVDEQGRTQSVSAKQMGELLRDDKILLALLNACFTGAAQEQDMARGVGQELVRTGVPVAVATTRPVVDHTALGFAREFYRALVDGYPVEAAVVEARKSLSVKGWDWSAYVVYARDKFPLYDLRIPVLRVGPTAPTESPTTSK
jgi:hypothetical protein